MLAPRLGELAADVPAARRPKLLIADDDPNLRGLLADVLGAEGFDCIAAPDGTAALRAARSTRPDLVLLDVTMPGATGPEVQAALHADFRTRLVPVIFLSATTDVSIKVDTLHAGADDYVTKPFDLAELIARIRAALRRSSDLRELNPLTGLPGNNVISQEIGNRLTARRPFACIYADLDQFKGFNDYYGWARGDRAIVALADVLLRSLDSYSSTEHFVGHIGGDDFIVLTAPTLGPIIAADTARRFDAAARALYDEADWQTGSITTVDRQGNERRLPPLTVSMGVASTALRSFTNAAEVASVAAELKEYAKRQRGSSWAADRRTA